MNSIKAIVHIIGYLKQGPFLEPTPSLPLKIIAVFERQSLASAEAQGNVVRAICISKAKPPF
jgi:hypothetical protein